MHTVGVLRGLVMAAGICLLAAPSLADIKSFNAAVQANDYKRATAEAAATWPTLNKSRKDIAIIAREFAFAAYKGGDSAAAKTYAEAAIAAGQAEAEDLRLASEILLLLAEHTLAPSESTRDKVYVALEKRAALPDMDMIAYDAAEEIVFFDFARTDWKDAAGSSALGAKLAAKGGELLAPQRHRFDLNAAVASFMNRRTQQPYDDLQALTLRIVADVDAAPDDAAAKRFEDVYWDVSAWSVAIQSLLTMEKRFTANAGTSSFLLGASAGDRAARLLNLRVDDPACVPTRKAQDLPDYPDMAVFSGIAGAVIVQFDTDEQGAILNPRILAAAPSKIFGDAVLRHMRQARYEPGAKWGPGCSLARQARTATYSFFLR